MPLIINIIFFKENCSDNNISKKIFRPKNLLIWKNECFWRFHHQKNLFILVFYLYGFFTINLFFLIKLKICCFFFDVFTIFRNENGTKSSGNIFRTNSNNLNGILSYILDIIFIYSKKRKIGKWKKKIIFGRLYLNN